MTAWKPKLIALDIDGTLLNSARQITPPTKDAIAEARSHEIIVVPCSGRHYSGTRSLALQAGMGDAVICGNGALVTTWSGEVISAAMLNPQRCKALLRFCEFYHLGCNLYADDILYALKPNSVTSYYENLNMQLPQDAQCKYRFVQDMDAAIEENAEKILKFEIFPVPDEPRKNLLDMLGACADMTAEGNLRTSVELHASGVSKATGLLDAARYYGIPMKQVLAVGDAENDVDMLRAAGLGAAMGNAIDAAKEAADEVIPSNDENGVAWVIRNCLR